uniref:HTH CENPB-type domain-containing protein n=1 Tax=Magallana gigas TaxID=29159 RepID=A0A8W8HXK3_MAGGI
MAPTQSRRSYTAGFKLEVIAFAEQNGGNMAAERKFGVTEKVIRGWRKQKDALQRTKKSRKSFRGRAAKKTLIPEGNLEKFVVVKRKAARRGVDIVYDFQSTEAPKKEIEWNVQSEVLEREHNCGFQHAETQEMEPIRVLQSLNSLETRPDYDFQSTEVKEREPIRDLQTAVSLKKEPKWDYQSTEVQETENNSHAVFQSVERHNTLNNQVGNIGTKMSTKKSRKSYTAGFKLAVIAFAEKNGGNMAAERKFGVGEKVIRDWRKQKKALQQTRKSKKAFRGLAAQWPDLEDKLEEYVKEQRAASRDLSTLKIRLKAKEMAKEMQINNFEGCKSWCFRFLRRKNIVLRQRKNHAKEKDVFSQQTNSSSESFQESEAKSQELDGNLENFVVVKTEAASSYIDTVQEFQSAEAPKLEPDWEVRLAEESEMEPNCDIQSTEAQKMGPVLDLQLNDSLERDPMNCDLQSVEALKREPDSDRNVQLMKASKMEPNYIVESTERQKLEPVLDLQSNEILERDNNCEFQNAEAPGRVRVWDLQSFDSSESEINCGFQSFVTEAPQCESTRDTQTAVEPKIEPNRDFCFTKKQKRTPNSQVGNKDQITSTTKTRKSYTAGFKLEVIAFAEKNGGNRAAERKFGVGEKAIRDWRKQKTALQQTRKSKKAFRGLAAQWRDLEDKLEEYVKEQRAASRDLSAIKIRLKAKEMAKEMQIHNFEGNASWCFRFLRRKNIVLRQCKNHAKEKDVFSQQTNSLCESFQGSEAKSQELDGNLENFVMASKMEPNYVVESTERQKLEPVLDLQSNDLLERDNNCEFQNAEAPGRVRVWDLQSFDSSESEINCGFQSFVTEAPQCESTRDTQTAVEPKIEPNRDFCFTKKQKRTPNSQVGNKDQITSTTKTRKSYTAGFKLEVIAFAEKNGGNRAAERKFGVGEKAIRDWRKQKTALQQTRKSKKAFRGLAAQWRDLEDKLEEYVKEQRAASRDLSAIKIRLKAKEMAKEMQIHNFEGNASWCFRFLRRKNIVLRQCKNHAKEKDVFSQQTNSLCESFQGSEAKSQELDGNLENFVVVKTEITSSYIDTVQEFQSAEAPKMEPDWEVRDNNCEFQNAEAPGRVRVWDLQSFDSSDSEINCGFQSFVTEAPQCESTRVTLTAVEPEIEPNRDFHSTKKQKRTPNSQVENIDQLTSTTKTRKSYTAGFKLGVIAFAEENGGNMAAERKFGVCEKNIRDWRKQKTALQQTKKSKKSFRGHAAQWPDLEDKLEEYVKEQRAASRDLSAIKIRLKAREMAKEMQMNNFEGCKSWFSRFMRRKNIVLRQCRNHSKNLSVQSIELAESEPICDFLSAVPEAPQRETTRDLQVAVLPGKELHRDFQSTEEQKRNHNIQVGNKDTKTLFIKPRKSYTAGFKLEVIAFAEKNGGNMAAEKKFGVCEKNIRDWRKQKLALQQTKKSKKSFRGHAVKWPDLENKLEEYVKEQRAASRDLSTLKIRLKAREMAKEMQIRNFEGNASWCLRFLRRKNIVLRQLKNHAKEKDVCSQQTNSSCESFQGSEAKSQELDGNLEKFVVVKTEATNSYIDTVQEFQSAEEPKMEPDWEVRLAEEPEMEPNCDIQSTEAQKMVPVLDLQLNDSLERGPMNCDLQSAEALEREPDSDRDVQLMKASKMEPNYVVESTERQKLEPVLDLQSFDTADSEINCGFQSFVTEAPQCESTRDTLTAVEPEIEPNRDFHSTEKQKRTPNSQVENIDQLTSTTKTRRSYTAGFKLEVIAFAEKNGGNMAAERKFGVGEKVIRGWRKQKLALQQTKKSKKSFRGHAAQWPDLEDKLEEYVKEQRAASRDLSAIKIRLKAREMAKEMQIHNFEGNVSWCFRFMKRKNIVLRQRKNHSKDLSGQSIELAESEPICDFLSAVPEEPQRETTRDLQVAVLPGKELNMDFQSTEEQKRTRNNQVGNKDIKTETLKPRKSYTAGFKLEVIAFAEENGGNMAAEKKFGVSKKNIRGWRKQKLALQQAKKSKKSFNGHAVQWPDLEDKLEKYIMEQRAAKRHLNGVKIRLKAREMAREMGIHDFEGTASWCFRFMKRKNIVLRQLKNHSKDLSGQSIELAENEPICDFLSAVPEEPQRENTRDLQVAVLPGKELNRDFQSTEEQKRTRNNQVGNKDIKTETLKPRKSYTAGFKLEVIAFAEENGGNMAAEKKFGVSEKNIRGWRKQKLALQQAEKSKKSFRGHAAQWPDLEDKLEKYIMEQRAAKRHLNGVKIRLKAREMAREMGIHDFEGTASWCFRFMKRKNIVLRHCKFTSKDLEVSP